MVSVEKCHSPNSLTPGESMILVDELRMYSRDEVVVCCPRFEFSEIELV